MREGGKKNKIKSAALINNMPFNEYLARATRGIAGDNFRVEASTVVVS